jgi:hypothetical protein
MPELSRFYGLIVAMFYNDHAPPHFHVRYGKYSAAISIETGAVLKGDLPGRALHLVQDWASAHQGELRDNRERERQQEPLNSIAPLE